jgi:hypothetical protein
VAVRWILFTAKDRQSVLASSGNQAFEAFLKAVARREAVIANVPIPVVHAFAGWASAEFVAHQHISDARALQSELQIRPIELGCELRAWLAPNVDHKGDACVGKSLDK